MLRSFLPLLLALALPLGALADGDAADDRSFEQRVNEAIDKGVAWLKGKQRDDGTWPEQREGFEPGSDALCLLALARSGVHVDDPVMQKGFDHLLKQPFQKTYTVAVTILAIEAAFCSVNPKEQYRARKAWGSRSMVAKEGQKVTRDRARKKMIEAVKWLLSAYNQELKGWRYTANDGIDHSHVQYVLLALKAACRCGLGDLIPDDLWLTILNTMIERQEKNGPVVKKLGTIKEQKKKRSGSVEVREFHGYGRRHSVRARGWAYDPQVRGDPATGSMTSAGVAIAQLCRDEIWRRKYRKYDRKTDAKALKAIESGVAWLALHFTVEENPFHPKGEWHYYYLFGLERVGVFLGLEQIGDHDWYREGGEYLLKQQHHSGAWPDEEKTCYSLLFLKRASFPLEITGK